MQMESLKTALEAEMESTSFDLILSVLVDRKPDTKSEASGPCRCDVPGSN